MNSLEFVNEKINWAISKIKDHEEQLLKFKGNKERDFFYIVECQCLNHYKEELEKFKQIKTELEALKIIKDTLVLNVETATAKAISMDGNVISLKGYWLVQGDIQKRYTIYPNEYETLKKALEIDNE